MGLTGKSQDSCRLVRVNCVNELKKGINSKKIPQKQEQKQKKTLLELYIAQQNSNRLDFKSGTAPNQCDYLIYKYQLHILKLHNYYRLFLRDYF